MIKISNLAKSYGDLAVLEGINLHIKPGEIFAIVGHSGAGKSTLLRCINGLESYQSGSLEVFGQEISALQTNELAALRREVGMIFQHFALPNLKRVKDIVATPLRFAGRKNTSARVAELLELVGLSERAEHYAAELSGGQKQRVAIARALALEPKILLSDEATSALDPLTTNQILDLLASINERLGICVVLVTHEMEAVKRIAHRACLLEGGRIIGAGDTKEIFLRPSERMRSFLGAQTPTLPGCNIRLVFLKNAEQSDFISHLARSTNARFSIVAGQIERLRGEAVGELFINAAAGDKEQIAAACLAAGVEFEVLNEL